MGRMTEANLEQYKATKAPHFEQIIMLQEVETMTPEQRRIEVQRFADTIANFNKTRQHNVRS